MVIKTHRLARPFLALAAIALMALVAVPSASIADTIPSAYPVPTTAPGDQNSTLEDALTALGLAGLAYLIITD